MEGLKVDQVDLSKPPPIPDPLEQGPAPVKSQNQAIFDGETDPLVTDPEFELTADDPLPGDATEEDTSAIEEGLSNLSPFEAEMAKLYLVNAQELMSREATITAKQLRQHLGCKAPEAAGLLRALTKTGILVHDTENKTYTALAAQTEPHEMAQA